MGRRLASYRRKRHFGLTPEPPASDASPRANPRPIFVVHKHDASRLHYDLRLELGGALASWAIPRGPSYDPAQKRLAIETEDHPLAYADFEGRIPEGEYGAGDSLLWDRGTWCSEPPGEEPQQRARGRMLIRLEGAKLVGLWHLIRTGAAAGDKTQWLFFKAKDELAGSEADIVESRPESVVTGRRVTRPPVRARQRRARHPRPIELLARIWPPMLAFPATPGSLGPGPWSFEVKYDGFRALAGLSQNRVALQSRNALDLAARFPGIASALAGLKVGEAVVDGEIVGLDEEGRSRFELLQSGTSLHFVGFDLLWLEGEDLRGRPLDERRELLRSVFAGARPPLVVSERIEAPLDGALQVARRRGLEGLLAKRAASRYSAGRSKDWRKLKLAATQDVVVVGWLPISSGGNFIGALLVAVHDGRGLRYAGRVGTGFTDEDRERLWRELERSAVAGPPAAGAPRPRGVRWTEPRLVAQVRFTEWTADGMLRHPSFQGLRPDKRPEECVREPGSLR